MNRLKNHSCYLIGPIDCTNDYGRGWRQNITKFLKEKNIIVFDPTNKPLKDYHEDENFILKRKKLKQEGKYNELAELIKPIRHIDLRLIDLASFCIAHLDFSIPMCGTWEEFFWANREKKILFTHIEGGIQNANDWLFATIPTKHIFGNWENLKYYITGIDFGTLEDKTNRLILFDF